LPRGKGETAQRSALDRVSHDVRARGAAREARVRRRAPWTFVPRMASCHGPLGLDVPDAHGLPERDMAKPVDVQFRDSDDDETILHERPRSIVGPSTRPPPVNPGTGSLDRFDFDRYEERRTLGRGSMGEVRLCKDTRIGREVAMKMILPEHGADAQIRARFLREARIQGQLEHPSIVPVHDLGVDGAGGMYFTMKCLRGMTLAQIIGRLRAGDPDAAPNFSRRKLLTSFSSVCLTIDFAHSRGVLHRDLKPSNVMLGAFGEVYVLDWGIAKIKGDASDGEQPVEIEDGGEDIQTVAGKALGTFGYMAPEQVLGKIAELDARTDVYALGAILFEILALEPLHPRTTWSAMLNSTLKGGSARPTARRPDLGVPIELEAICAKATAVHPHERFQSARELHEAVERYLDGDRDTEIRRQMVSEYASAAKEAAARAVAGGDGAEDARRAAIHDVGRTLALDPKNRTATKALGRVMASEPAEVPSEVAEALERSTALRYRIQLQAGMRFDLWTAVIMAPLAWWMGIRDAALVAVAVACTLTSSLFKLAGVRRSVSGSGWHVYACGAYLFNIGALFALGRSFGPLFVAPTLFAIFTFTYCMSHHRAYRFTVLAMTTIAMLTPVFAEVLGAAPRSYVFQGGAMTILPHAVKLLEVPTIVSLTLVNLLFAIAPALLVGRLHWAQRASEQRSMLQAWHLRQLLPDEARALSWDQRPFLGPTP
jgi:eukaryotic-like serine/threonine-protein kinase